MKNFFISILALAASVSSPFADAQQISYEYSDVASAEPVSVRQDSADSYSAVISVPALCTLADSPEQILSELNKRIAEKTTLSLEERFPGVHFKVKDEDLEYDKLYFDQSEDGNVEVVRMRHKGDIMYQSLLGHTVTPDFICSWIWDDKDNTEYQCYTKTEGAQFGIWIAPTLKEGPSPEKNIELQCTEAHEKKHIEDIKKYLNSGIKGHLHISSLDSVEKISEYRKRVDVLNAKITFVMEAGAMRAEIERLEQMEGITNEERAAKERELETNPAPISNIDNDETKGAKKFDGFVESDFCIKIDENTEINLEHPSGIVTYGEIYKKLGKNIGINLDNLLERLVMEKKSVMIEAGTKIKNAGEKAGVFSTSKGGSQKDVPYTSNATKDSKAVEFDNSREALIERILIMDFIEDKNSLIEHLEWQNIGDLADKKKKVIEAWENMFRLALKNLDGCDKYLKIANSDLEKLLNGSKQEKSVDVIRQHFMTCANKGKNNLLDLQGCMLAYQTMVSMGVGMGVGFIDDPAYAGIRGILAGREFEEKRGKLVKVAKDFATYSQNMLLVMAVLGIDNSQDDILGVGNSLDDIFPVIIRRDTRSYRKKGKGGRRH